MSDPPAPAPPAPGSGSAGDATGRAARLLPAVLLVGALLAAWEIGVAISGVSPIVLPGPSRILGALWEFRETAARHAAVTLTEALVGFAVAVVLAVLVALAMDRVAAVRRAVYPLLVGSQTIPIVAIAPLLVVWFGFGLAPKVVVIVLVSFFPIVVATLDAFAATPAAATDLMRTLGATRGQEVRLLRWPAALPGLFTGMRIAVPYAVIGAVFGEYVGAIEGLGIWMQVSQNAFRTDLVFAAILLTAILSIGLFLAVGLAERLVIPWHRAALRAGR